MEVTLIDPKKIDHFAGNARRRNTPEDVGRLAESIQQLAEQRGEGSYPEAGLIQPVTLRPSPTKKGRFENVCGSRRQAALMLLQAKRIPALVQELTDKQAVEISAAENLQRDDLHPIEEAEAYRSMIDAGFSVKSIAGSTGRSESHVYKRLRLVELDVSILERFWSGEHPDHIAPLHFIEIAKLPTHAGQREAYEAIASAPSYQQSIDMFRGWVSQYGSRRLADAPFSQTVELPVIGADEMLPTCKACEKRSDKQAQLFDDDGNDNRSAKCLDPVCWSTKLAAHIQVSLDSGMAGVSDSERLDGNDRYVAPQDIADKKAKLPREKVLVLDGYDKGKIVEMVPREEVKPELLHEWAREGGSRQRSDDGRRKMSKEEKADIDEAMATLVGMMDINDLDAAVIFDTLLKASSSAVLKLVSRRTAIELDRWESKLPKARREAQQLVCTLLLTERCEHHGEQREALRNVRDVLRSYGFVGDDAEAIEAICDTWLTKKGEPRPNGRDRYKARQAKAATA